LGGSIDKKQGRCTSEIKLFFHSNDSFRLMI
jgi:hypothetical protein